MKKPIPVVKLENISKSFPGVQALESVSFEVFPGEIVAVIGENGAGKSTLMNILAGVLQPDRGIIIVSGEIVTIENPNVSQNLGISVVYQEMSTCPNLSVAENISLIEVSSQSSLGLVDRKKIIYTAKKVLSQLALDISDLNMPVGDLSIAHQQLVEIAKAISTNARLIIFDEPTSALTEEDSKNLFQIIRGLKAEGVSILYVSHHFEDVISLADRVVVLRDGKQIDLLDIDKVTVDILIEKVAGSAVVDLYKNKAKNSATPEVGLEVVELSNNKIQNISFSVNKGLILGIAGLPDSGKDELGECLYGLRNYQGKIVVDGNQIALNSPTCAINNGISYVPANRRESGAILSMNVRDNIIASSINQHSKAGLLNKRKILSTARKFINDLRIKISKITQLMSTISGGNQQKIILSKCLATNPSILLLHEPTRGIDVGAKAEIYKILEELAEKKVSIVIISSELIELMSQCNQILVLYEGKIRGKFDQEEFDEKKIVSCLMGESICL